MAALHFQTIPELLTLTAQTHSSALALKLRSGLHLEKHTYGELLAQAEQMTVLLTEHGICHGDRVLLWDANAPGWVIAYLGTLMLGAVVVPLDVRSTPGLVQKITAQTEPRLAIVGKAMVPAIAPLGLPHLVIENLALELARVGRTEDMCCVQPQDLAEIMYTSGTMGAPKGVMLTQRNLTANVEMALTVMPIRAGFRILSLLPLSHMYEQIVGLLVPLASGASIVYLSSRQPNVLLQTLQREKINGMALVPQALSLILNSIEQQVEEQGLSRVWKIGNEWAPHLPVKARRLLFAPVHRRLGGHLEFIMIGGAALPAPVGKRWENLGIPILEGYGGSEATAIVSGNLPHDHRAGTVGRPVPGIDLKIAGDGEILVKGENIFCGYWKNPQATTDALEDGWYHTGDLGAFDADGYLQFRGRKKNLIALADGQKVHAEDVEAALFRRPGIRDAIVVGLPDHDKVQVHAVVLAVPGEENEVARSIRAANETLMPHQQIKDYTLWKEQDFPRTFTLKVKRYEVLRQLTGNGASAGEGSPVITLTQGHDVRHIVADFLHIPLEAVQPSSRLVRDLMLDSLSMVELLFVIEEQLGIQIVEQELPTDATIADMETLVGRQSGAFADYRFHFSYWTLNPIVMNLRALLQLVVLHPLSSLVMHFNVRGRERLENFSGPCLVIANHSSHLDAVAVMRALPSALRRHVAIGAAADYWFDSALVGSVAGILYNLYPLVRHGSARPSLEHSVELLDRGWSILLFPEGTRTLDGKMNSFRSGIGLLAAETGVPVIPMRIEGTFQILPKGQLRPRGGSVTVTIGAPFTCPLGSDSVAVTRELEVRVRNL